MSTPERFCSGQPMQNLSGVDTLPAGDMHDGTFGTGVPLVSAVLCAPQRTLLLCRKLHIRNRRRFFTGAVGVCAVGGVRRAVLARGNGGERRIDPAIRQLRAVLRGRSRKRRKQEMTFRPRLNCMLLYHEGPNLPFSKWARMDDDVDLNNTITPGSAAGTASHEALRISEIRYRRLFEAAQDGVLLIDPNTRKITDANPFMTKLLDYPHDQLVGKELFEIGLVKDERASQEMFRELQENGHVRYEDLPLESQEGGHREVEVVANVYDENGRSVIQCNIRDITVRKNREAHNKLLVAEVNHRARNLLAVVQVIAQQTAKHADQKTFVKRLTERIGGLAASQDLLVENQWQGVEVAKLVRSQLAHLRDLLDQRVLLDGPHLHLKPAAAQGIGMALHELATNAGKYGALSNADGRVLISWGLSAEKSLFSMSWVEELGPAVDPPSHKGFGQKVIENMVEAAVDGTTHIDYGPTGFTWKLDARALDVLELSTLDIVGKRS